MTDLPTGWEWARLNDVAEVQGGIQKQQKRRPVRNKYPFLRVANVLRGRLDLQDVHEVELFDGELEKYTLQRDDLLVVEGNGSIDQIGRAALWNGTMSNCVHQNHLIRIRPYRGLDPHYLGLLWNSPATIDQLKEKAWSTSGLYTLSVSKLKSISLPVPPLEEQRRIVATLEDHLSRLDVATESLTVAKAKVDLLATSALRSLLAEANAPAIALANLLAEKPINGRSVPTEKGGFPVLRLTAIRDGRIDLTERKAGAWSHSEAKSFLVKQGDFLVSRGNGSLSLVGRGGLVDIDPDPVAFPDTLIRLRPNEQMLRAGYLSLIWNSPVVRHQIESSARTTAGIYKINQSMLRQVRIPVPSIDQQRTILAEMEEISLQAARSGTAVERNQARTRKLRRSLFNEAFGGRLVGQDPRDEPASVLLGRIRAERAARPKVTRGRRSKAAEPGQGSLL